MKKRIGCLLLVLLLMTCLTTACADPDLTLQDPSVRSGSWTEAYLQILKERSEGIQAYQDYVISITYTYVCRAVGLTDLTGDGVPELLFLDLVEDTEYGFKVGRLWIYTPDRQGVHCALTLQPEIDDLLYSRYYLADNGLLTVYLSDCEAGWILQLRSDRNGHYEAVTTITDQEDFSGEGPDYYYQNGKKISAGKYKSLKSKIQKGQGSLIGSLQVDEGGYGLTYTLAEALEFLASGKADKASGANGQPASAVK